jgi:DNA-binding XRE family transcriptional regulator
MAGHKPFRNLAARVEARIAADPVRRARSEARRRAMDDVIRIAALRELREQRGATQTALADTLGTSQANISQIEGRDDIYLSTLAHYVEALGGRLEITAVFPDQTIYLLGQPTPEPAQTSA